MKSGSGFLEPRISSGLFNSLLRVLCASVPPVFKKAREYTRMASTGAVAKAAFDTEDTEAQRPQRDAREFRDPAKLASAPGAETAP
jgi:hypothetical protein